MGLDTTNMKVYLSKVSVYPAKHAAPTLMDVYHCQGELWGRHWLAGP